MTVRQLETEMPGPELSEWLAHLYLTSKEAEQARKKAKK